MSKVLRTGTTSSPDIHLHITAEHRSRKHDGISYIYVVHKAGGQPVRLQTPKMVLDEITRDRTRLHDDSNQLAAIVNSVEDAVVELIGPTDLTLERTQFPMELKTHGVTVFISDNPHNPVEASEESLCGKPVSMILQLEGLTVQRPQGVAKAVWKLEQAMLYPLPKVNPFADTYAFLEDEEYDSLED